MKGTFYAVQERAINAAPTVPWAFVSDEHFAHVEEATDWRRILAGRTMSKEYRVVRVNVTTEIIVVEGP